MRLCTSDRVLISIHALVKRATRALREPSAMPPNFNPRPREKGDIKHIGINVRREISIHALVKRATYAASLLMGMIKSFQSTPS